MSVEKLVRLEWLKAHCRRLGLTKEDGTTPSPTKLGARIDRETNYTSDLLLGRRSFGEDIARHIEDRLGLGRWALDGGAGWPFAGIDRARFDALTLDQRMEIQGVVRERIERFEAAPTVTEVAPAVLEMPATGHRGARRITGPYKAPKAAVPKPHKIKRGAT